MAGMRLSGVPLAALFGVFTFSVATAQEDELGLCRAIEDGARRLECYDAIPLRPNLLRRKYEAVPLDELKTYRLSYRGRLVEVEGWVKPDGEYLALGLSGDDATPMPIDVEALNRRDRQAVFEECAAGCEAVVQGRVGPVNFTTGIAADTVVVVR
jgi:hypothetical protein